MKQNQNTKLEDIAATLGVSPSTVSRAISGKGRISKGTREKILDYIEKVNYKPNIIAKSLAQSKSFNIGAIIPYNHHSIQIPFFQKCLLGINEIAIGQGYNVILVIIKDDDISQIDNLIINQKIDGFILTRTLVSDQIAEKLLSTNIPFVSIGSSKYNGVVDVDNDNEGGSRELTSLLLNKRNTKIALIGDNVNYTVTQDRLRGFIAAHNELDIKVNKELIFLGIDSEEKIYNIVDLLYGKDIDYFLCMDDMICGFVYKKIISDNQIINSKSRIASFMNSEILEHFMTNIIAVNYDILALGRLSAKILFDVINGFEVPKRTVQEYKIIFNNSSKKI